MKKVLFLIHDLGQGGAEKVLVNLVNNMDREQFDITVIAMFGGGINEQFLKPHIHFKSIFKKPFPGNSHVMKLFSPAQLHKWFIKEHYDIEISYLEGPDARIISGCPDSNTALVGWVHIQQYNRKRATGSFRNYKEASRVYNRFDRIVCVSNTVREDFTSLIPLQCMPQVLYNTNETEQIVAMASESVNERVFSPKEINLIGVGKLLINKGFQRLFPMIKRFREQGLSVHLYILGDGPMKKEWEEAIAADGIEHAVTFLGYQTNPYKYIAKCDLFVCASYAEGFSTAATEALIVGTPVCTVEVSGMKEMLGENNEYGIVVENNDKALYQGIKQLLDDPALLAHYKEKAIERGKDFSTEKTVKAVENMLLEL